MRKDSGFSLIELMTVIGVLAILTAVAVPSFINWRGKSQLSRASRDVYSSFQKAKVEAIRRNTTCGVTFRFAQNDYLIWLDSAGDLSFNGDEEVITTVRWSDYPGIKLDPNEGGGFGVTFTNQTIFFAPDGLPRNNTGGLASGTVFLTNQGNNRQNRVSVSPAGNIQISQTG